MVPVEITSGASSGQSRPVSHGVWLSDVNPNNGASPISFGWIRSRTIFTPSRSSATATAPPSSSGRRQSTREQQVQTSPLNKAIKSPGQSEVFRHTMGQVSRKYWATISAEEKRPRNQRSAQGGKGKLQSLRRNDCLLNTIGDSAHGPRHRHQRQTD